MRVLLALCSTILATTVPVRAQQRPPSALRGDELIARTRAAAEELTTLDAKAGADRAAFQTNQADLREAIARLGDALPEKPQTLDDVGYDQGEFIATQIEKAVAFKKAWDKRHGRRERAAQALEALEGLTADLHEAHELLFDRVGDLRPLFIEAQRRIERGDLTLEDFALPEGARSVTGWVARTTELNAARQELLRGIEEAVSRLADDRKAFAAIPPEDPELSRYASRLQMALGAIAEATALGKDLLEHLKKVPPETIPTEVNRIATEWLARRSAVEQAAALAEERLGTLDKSVAELEALTPPRREDLPEVEGLPEIRKARDDVEYSTGMIAYFEQYAAILERGDAERKEALTAIEEASNRQTTFARQCARALESLDYAETLVSAGTLLEWKRPEDVSREIVWQEWRQSLKSEFDRRLTGDRLSAELDDAQDIDQARAQVAAERTNKQRAEASLAIELSLAESVGQVRQEADAALLALLAPEGELAKGLEAIDKEVTEGLARREAATQQCLETASRIEEVESPYSRKALTRRAERMGALKKKLDELQEGAVPANAADNLDVELEGFSQVSRDVGLEETVAQIAEREHKYLESRQQDSSVFVEYFENLNTNLQELQAGRAARTLAETTLEEAMQRRIQEEKRRYAAAREIRRRADAGQFDSSKLPERLGEWLGREGIRQAETGLNDVRREDRQFRERTAYEAERLETLLGGFPIAKIRAQAAAERVRLIGRPVTYLSAAITSLEELDDVEQMTLDFDARVMESEASTMLQGLFKRFSNPDERARFEEPLRTYHLELANQERVINNIENAEAAYHEIVTICEDEKREMIPARGMMEVAIALRVFDYHAARHAAAVARYPGSRARLEEAFRTEFRQALPYRLNFLEGDRDFATTLLFSSEARLQGQLALARHIDILLSKVGIDSEIDWYRSQIARIGSLRQGAEGRKKDLAERIAKLSDTYGALLSNNALKGLGIVLVIPLIAYLLVRLLRRFTSRFERQFVGMSTEDISDRQRRLQTLSNTSTAAIAVLVWTVALIYIFARLGLDITPIVASASVLGLAVAFGAQALIKDFFSGFFILIENQFTIGDVVTLGTVSGTVEKISLRVTVLRDLKGIVHYIPNGSIGQVSNQTQGWSRVVMEVSVNHKEDPDRVTGILGDVLLEMAGDEKLRHQIIEEPVVAGVENLTEHAVDIRVMIKTRPGKQWGVAREARRRIRKRFNELGVEIPFPHRVVHHVYEGSPEGKPPEAADVARGAGASGN